MPSSSSSSSWRCPRFQSSLILVFLLTVVPDRSFSLPVENEASTEESPETTTSTSVRIPSGPPKNLKVIGSSQRSIALTWDFETDKDKFVHGYRIFYMHETFKDVKTIKTSNTAYNLTRLEPYTTYKVWVKGLVSDSVELGPNRVPYESEKSDPIEARTDVDEPSSPEIINATCFDTGAIYLKWNRPEDFDKSVDYYYIYYRTPNEPLFRHLSVQANSKPSNEFVIKELRGRQHYIIKICAGTKSISDPSRTWKGSFSNEVQVYLPERECKESASPMMTTTTTTNDGAGGFISDQGELSAGMIAGAICAFLFLLLAIFGFILWRQYFTAAYYYLDGDPPRVVAPVGIPDWEGEPGPDGEHGPIAVDDFSEHVAKLHCDSDIGFSKEYEEIQRYSTKNVVTTHEHSSHPDNKSKNRYLNIVAYDHSRVQLAPLSGQKKTSDYINGNFIDGFQKFHAYIGTQGPLDDTFEAFWRMVWEQNVYVLVMITNLMERGRRKCDLYWPKEVDSSEIYGQIEVTLLKEEVMANYTLRTMKIKHLKDVGEKVSTLRKKKWNTQEREIKQFHYTSWPDHGVPSHPLPVLSFIRRSSSANPSDGGPVVVHCSAGVGRTGTYIAIDAMLQQIKAKSELNIFGFLKHIRGQRNHLVQTEEQYVFIHDALLEATKSGNTEVQREKVREYIEKMMLEDLLTKSNLLQRQFKLITSFTPSEFHFMSARQSYNLSKNRDQKLIPVEMARVALSPRPGVEGSDYINATWLHGHSKLKEFVMTQHPTKDTKDDFWKMLWDHNAQTVVLLSPIDDDEFPVFWPVKDEEFDQESFRVRFIEESVHEEHSTFDFVVSSRHDDYELAVRIIHCPEWHTNQKQNDCLTQGGFDALKLVQDWHLEYQDGPLVVVDRYGGTDAASFSALTTLCKELDKHSSIDVYQVAKLYHNVRPGVWKTEDDVLHLYKAMDELIASNQANPVQGDAVMTTSAAAGSHSEACSPPVVANGINGTIPGATAASTGNDASSNDAAAGMGACAPERRHSASDWQSSDGSLSKSASSSTNNNRRYSLPEVAPSNLSETTTTTTTTTTAPTTSDNVQTGNGCVINIQDEDEEEDEEEDDQNNSELAALTNDSKN